MERDLEVERAGRLARWLDDRMLDPIIGFFLPGVGDFVTSGLGLYILTVAWRKGLPPVVIARMLLNLAADAAVGAIPVAGDLFDIAFKANKRNMRLLEERHLGRAQTFGDWVLVLGAMLLFLGALALPILVLVKIAEAIF